MLTISAEQASHALSIDTAAGIVDATYRAIAAGDAKASSPSILRLTGDPFRLGAKGAVLDHLGIAGMRLTSRASSRLMLWSLETGEPLALLDESQQYRFRTGVSAAVCARYLLANTPVGRVAIIGAGPIALEVARAVEVLLSPGEIVVASRSLASAQQFVEKARAAGCRVAATPDAPTAVAGAELIITITNANSVLVGADDIAPGALVLSMGGRLEVSHAVWQQADLRLVDDLDYALGQGDAAAWIAAGTYDSSSFCQSLSGTIADLAIGRIAPPANGQSAMAIVQGTTALDVALAHAVFLSAGGHS